MPFGMGPAGWAYGYPYPYAGGSPYYGGYGWPWAPLSKEQEIAILEDQARALEHELEGIRERLEELKK